MNFDEMDRGLETALKSRLSGAQAVESPFHTAHQAFEAARRVAERVGALRDKLVGPRPCGADECGADECGAAIRGPSGVLGDMRDHADRTVEALAVAEAALTEIERNLP